MSDLIALPRISYTALDFETIINDIRRIITENPEYNQNWEDFLQSNAGRMIVEMVSYIVDLLAFRVDWQTNELYISTATQRQSIINLLKLINYRLTLPQAAQVRVNVSLSTWVEPFDLPTRLTLNAVDRDGNPTTFELLLKNADGDFYYFGDDAIVTLDTGSVSNQITSFTGDDALVFYEGDTKIQDETMTGADNETVTLTESPVIEGSIQIWTLDENNDEVEKLPLVTSFVAEDAQQKEDGSPLLVPPYMIDVNDDNSVLVRFPSAALANTFDNGDSIRIYYRVGGGNESNIVAGAINETKSYIVNSNPVTAVFTNPEAGAGGADAEDVFEARRTAPLYLTTADKTVSPLDYQRILLEHPSVLKAKVYGKVNEPAAIFDEYDYTIPTFESWIYIVPNVNYQQYDPRTEYNTFLQPTKPYEIKSMTASFPAPNFLSGRISFSTSTTQVTGNASGPHKTYFSTELEQDDVIAIAGTGTGGEIFVGVVDYVETGSDSVLYLKEAPSFSATNQDFGISSLVMQIPTEFTPVYERYPAIDIENSSSGQTYIQGVDYTLDYEKGLITRVTPYAGYGIPQDTDLIITWWWYDEATADESDIAVLENYLTNKKMLCIDNVYQDTLYSTFDVQGIVYVEKNYNQELVKQQVDDLLFVRFSLLNRDYAETVKLPEIIAVVHSVPGVRYVNVTYFGHDYETYKANPSSPPSSAKNYGLDEIDAAYNEIIVVAQNEFEGATTSVDFQLHGVIFNYVEVPS